MFRLTLAKERFHVVVQLRLDIVVAPNIPQTSNWSIKTTEDALKIERVIKAR